MPRPTSAATSALVRRYGAPRATGPVDAALALLAESAGNVDALRTLVREKAALIVSGKSEREEIAGLVRLYNDERDRLAKLASDMMRIGIAERQIRLYEAQARVLVEIVREIVSECGLDADARKRATGIAARAIRERVMMTPNHVPSAYAPSNDGACIHDASSGDAA